MTHSKIGFHIFCLNLGLKPCVKCTAHWIGFLLEALQHNMVYLNRKPLIFSLVSSLSPPPPPVFRSISRHQTHLKPTLQILLPSLCRHWSCHQLQLLQMQRNKSRKVMKILTVALLMGCNSWNKDLTQLGKASFPFAAEEMWEWQWHAFQSNTTRARLRQE